MVPWNNCFLAYNNNVHHFITKIILFYPWVDPAISQGSCQKGSKFYLLSVNCTILCYPRFEMETKIRFGPVIPILAPSAGQNPWFCQCFYHKQLLYPRQRHLQQLLFIAHLSKFGMLGLSILPTI